MILLSCTHLRVIVTGQLGEEISVLCVFIVHSCSSSFLPLVDFIVDDTHNVEAGITTSFIQ